MNQSLRHYEASGPESAARLEQERRGDGLRLKASGAWTVAGLADVDAVLRAIAAEVSGPVEWDLADVGPMDTVGAWLVRRTVQDLEARGIEARLTGLDRTHALLIDAMDSVQVDESPGTSRTPPLVAALTKLGSIVVGALHELYAMAGFLGWILEGLGRTALRPRRLRLKALIAQTENAGVRALGIVILMNVLIGIVLAYQGVAQLERYGAQVFAVDLVAISILREIGVLLTAIIVAGRSGSAFTAEIGSMQIREEVDAMRTIGLDPLDTLVLPRVLALSVALPMLVIVADIAGLLGGAAMISTTLDISPGVILARLNFVRPQHLVVGLIKAPVFGILIGVIACYQGMRVSGSAESVGRMTTESVVESIFAVIIVDAIFSIFFATVRM